MPWVPAKAEIWCLPSSRCGRSHFLRELHRVTDAEHLDAFAEGLDRTWSAAGRSISPRAQNARRLRSRRYRKRRPARAAKISIASRLAAMACLRHLQLIAGLHAHDVAGPVRWTDQGDAGGIRAAAAQRFQHAEHGRAQAGHLCLRSFGNSLRFHTWGHRLYFLYPSSIPEGMP